MGSGKLARHDETYFDTVRGMCRSCRRIVPARITFRDDRVYQQSICSQCGPGRNTLISINKEDYLFRLGQGMPDESPVPGAQPSRHGCPFDCGPCRMHASRCRLPVFSITNACNMHCRHCFTYNRPDKLYFISEDEMLRTLDTMLQAAGGHVDLVNITGGEPTLHPELLNMLDRCKRPEIGRITMNSNGIRLAQDKALCAALAERNVCVVLSVNGFDDETLRFFHDTPTIGEIKRQAIDNLTEAGCRMTLLNVLARGVNEVFSGQLLDMMLDNDLILNLNFQTLTYTGQGGGRLSEPQQIPADEAAMIIAAHSKGRLKAEDFQPRPDAHFLCYRNCWLLKHDDELMPFRRFASENELSKLGHGGYLLHAGESSQIFRAVIDRLYAEGRDEECRFFRRILNELYPEQTIGEFERQKRAEKFVRSIYIHAHMDEDNFDASRVCGCPDQVPTPEGKMIPACAYNLFYRQKDERFYVE